ncbi:MAG: PAS domain S-box protein [Nitrospiraceae bacterium]|nr:PAS domain S-box protein [Nitrospiraceae bacterium]
MPNADPRLKEVAAHWAAIMASSDDALFSYTPSGVVTGWNPAAERLFGYIAEDMLGSSIGRMVPAQCRGKEATIIGRISRGERVAPYGTVRIKKNGQLCDVRLSVSPLIDEDGRVIGVSTIARSLMEQNDLERTVYAHEERWRVTLDHVGDAVVVTDAAGAVTFVNPVAAKLLGRPPAEMIGRPVAELFTVTDEETRQPVIHPVDHVIREGAVAEPTSHTLRRPDGTDLPIHDSAAPLLDAGGRVMGVVLLFRDITVNQQAEWHLQRWNAALEARVRERTRELVRSKERLRGLASQLSQTEQRERRRLATDLHDYLAQLLALTRIKVSHMKQRLEHEPVGGPALAEVDTMLEHSLSFTRTLMAQLRPAVLHDLGLVPALQWLAEQMRLQGLTVTVRVLTDERPRFTESQSDMLFQTVRELLMNTMKHAGVSQARVSLNKRGDDTWLITVQDEGIGFDVDAVDYRPSGEHFGLFSIQERMEAMAGWCIVESLPGTGTKVELGLTESPDAVTPERTTGNVVDEDWNLRVVGRSRWHVLLVDDHVMVRQGLRSLLETYDDLDVVAEAGDGEQAVEYALRFRPDVILMDINLPRLNGIQATRRIKTHYPETVVIGLSVHASAQAIDALLAAGAAAMVSKELAADDLRRTITQLLREPPAGSR